MSAPVPLTDEPTALSVLYLDHDAGVGQLARQHLRHAGFTVVLATTGSEGLARATAERFDVVALDHSIPVRDGLDVLADLRRVPAAPPVVFVTAADEPRIAVTALKQGAADFVVKDVHGAFLALLGPTLRQAVETARMQQAKELAEQELRESRDRLERLAAQQALMLREVNHRVANSLQLISAMIALQARRLDDGEARDLLRRSAQRVDAVALVHRRLYTSNDVEVVEMDLYLEGLVGEFRRALEADSGQAWIELQTEPVRTKTDKAVSIGLIVNELVTNTLKYAYLDRAPGPIRIWLAQAGTGLRLGVEDDGVGYPAESMAARGTGVGAMIIASMANTLKATITLDPDYSGTRFVLDVPG